MGGRRRGRGRWAMVAVLIGAAAASLAAAPGASAALAPPSASAWGDNELGQVGNGSRATVEFDSPLSVTLPAAVKQVAASPDDYASAAVLATGEVEVWGSNAFGEAGPSAPNPSLSPELISGLAGITQVAVGGGHVLALDSAGTVWSWGQQLLRPARRSWPMPASCSATWGITLRPAPTGARRCCAPRKPGLTRASLGRPWRRPPGGRTGSPRPPAWQPAASRPL